VKLSPFRTALPVLPILLKIQIREYHNKIIKHLNIVLGTIGQVIVDDGTDTFNIKTSEENDNEELFKHTKIKANLEATSVATKTSI
jgi:hypothetical protein